MMRQERRVSPERDFEMAFEKYDKSERNYFTTKRRDYSKNRALDSDRELSPISRNPV